MPRVTGSDPRLSQPFDRGDRGVPAGRPVPAQILVRTNILHKGPSELRHEIRDVPRIETEVPQPIRRLGEPAVQGRRAMVIPAVQEVPPNVGEQQRAPGSRPGQPVQGRPGGVLGEVLGDALPHEHGRGTRSVSGVLQAGQDILGLEVHCHQMPLGRSRHVGCPPPAAGDVRGQVDVEDRHVPFGQSQTQCVESGAQYDHIVDAFVDRGTDDLGDVPLAVQEPVPQTRCRTVGAAEQGVARSSPPAGADHRPNRRREHAAGV